ncbi:MAG: hypothetical protein Q4G59_10825, partial [Planctomycetia bacterium]|nr:hypothetical protein [Planctomycetia bacterium]
MLLFDLYGAHSAIIVTGPTNVLQQQSPLAEKIREERVDTAKQEITPTRIFTMEWYPLVLAQRKGPRDEFLRGLWDHMSLLPNHHYLHHLQNAHLTGTMVIDEYYFCLAWAELPNTNDISPLMAFLDVQDLIFPRIMSIPERGEEPMIKLDRNNVRLLAAAEKDATDILDTHGIPTDVAVWQITLPTSRLKIFHNCPVLDDPMFSTIDLVRSGRLDDRHENEYAKMTKYAHNRLEFETRLTQPGDIVLAEQYFPGWKAYVYRLDDSKSTLAQPLEIRQTLGFLRRVTLDAGTYRVVMEYRPR